MVEKDTKKVGCSFQENIAYLERVLPVKESFDIVRRDMEIGERAATFYFIDGFTKIPCIKPSPAFKLIVFPSFVSFVNLAKICPSLSE